MPFKNIFLLILLILPFSGFSENLVMFPESYEFVKEKAYSVKDKKYLFKIGEMHYFGVKHQVTGEIFVKPNLAQSLKDFKESYDLGYKKQTAPYIAHMYFHGAEDIEQNKKEGLKYYQDVLKYGNSKDKEEAIGIIEKNQTDINRIWPDFFKTTEGLPNNSNPYGPPITTPTTPEIPEQFTPRKLQSVPQDIKFPFSSLTSKPTKKQFNEFKKAFEPYLDTQIEKARSRLNQSQASLSGFPRADIARASLEIWLSQAEGIKRQLSIASNEEEYNRLREELLKLLMASPFANILRVVKVNTDKGSGNGFLYSSKYIITNYHVIDDSVGVKKQAQTGQEVEIVLTSLNQKLAKIIYYDCDKDLALLEIQGDPIKNEDLLKQKEINDLINLSKKSGSKQSENLVTEEDINKMLQSQLGTNIPLTSNVSKGSVVTYLKKDLSVIEIGKVIVLNNHYGNLKETNVVRGFSGGAVFDKDKVACVTQGGVTKKTLPKNDRRALCISSAQIKPFINKRQQKPEKFCKCKNFLLIVEEIQKYKQNKPLDYVVSAKAFLEQASKESIKALNKMVKRNVFKEEKKQIEKKIKKLNADQKKVNPNYQEPAANICRDF